MKKIYLILCLIIINIPSARPESYPLIHSAENVVSEVKTYNWKSGQGWYENQITKIIVQNYNEDGYIESEEWYNSDNVLFEKTEFFYDKDDENIIITITTNYNNEITRTSEIIHENDTITETVFRPNDTQLFKYISTVNRKDQITELKHFNGENELLFIREYTYTDNGDPETITLINPDGSIAVLIEIEYEEFDRKDNWLVRSEYYTYADVRARPRDIVYRTIEY
jgi:hypothetical protein